MRVFFAVGVVVCVLVCSKAAPIYQQLQDMRNFIPNRYEIKGTLINNDGTFTRQDPPPQPLANEQQQSMYNQFGDNGQASNLAYQPQGDYQPLDDPQYGQQSFQDFQQPQQSNFMAGQNDQNAFYNTQDLQADQNTQGYAESVPQDDDLRGQGESQSFNTMPYQANYNDQPPPESQQFQAVQPYYGDQQVQERQKIHDNEPPPADDDIRGSSRNIIEKAKEKAKKEAMEKRLGATKKFKIPKNLSPKDLQGMIGYGKQIYIRGGH